MLDADRIGLLARGLGFRVQCHDTVDSTNLIVKEGVRAGQPEGLVATALRQAGGYGRQGRTWTSPVGGLYFSILLRPQVPLERLPTLGLLCSLAVRQALAGLASGDADDIGIKWPNDVVCPQGKLCGISMEQVEGAVCAGIGINVFEPADARDKEVGGKNRPAYYHAFAGRPLPPAVPESGITTGQQEFMAEILIAALRALHAAYPRWKRDGFPAIRAEYLKHAALLGEDLAVETLNGGVIGRGVAIDIDRSGRLVLRTPAGDSVPVTAGEVHLR